MATRFELVLHGENPVSLRAAGEEALHETERLEAQLSLFRPTSEIAHLNARAARESVRVTPPVFGLLLQARRLSEETAGAFDITIAPLVRCWGFMGGGGSVPSPEQLVEARSKVGMNLVQLSERDYTVRFAREGVMLDLGAIGKGYAVERAADLLREAGVRSGLLHGGTSTVYALGRPPDEAAWPVAIAAPGRRGAQVLPAPASGGAPPSDSPGSTCGSAGATWTPLCEPETSQKNSVSQSERVSAQVVVPGEPDGPIALVSLQDQALSVSAVWGKSFESGGRRFGHIIDPRSGQPAASAVLAAVVLPSATETDALSTALLTLGLEGVDQIGRLRAGIRALVAADSGSGLTVASRGI
jgi:thiamine biosynthesis lipoprotein